VEGSEAAIATVEFSLLAALEAVIVIEIILIHHLLFLDHDALLEGILVAYVLVFGCHPGFRLYDHDLLLCCLGAFVHLLPGYLLQRVWPKMGLRQGGG
jgi:hypothetical protein